MLIKSFKSIFSGGSSVGSRPASKQKNGPQYFAAFAATIGSLIMGTTISWSSPAAPLLQLSPEEDGFNLTKDQVSWVGCLMPTGALIGWYCDIFITLFHQCHLRWTNWRFSDVKTRKKRWNDGVCYNG